MREALYDYALRLGDDSLILGQRLSEWCGHAPMLEIDLALANVALDLIGQSAHFLKLAAETEGKGRDADALAFHRDVLDFRNCLLEPLGIKGFVLGFIADRSPNMGVGNMGDGNYVIASLGADTCSVATKNDKTNNKPNQ